MNSTENRISLVNLGFYAIIFLLIAITTAYSQINSEIIFNSLKLKEHNSKIYTKHADKTKKDSASKSFEFPVQLSFEYGNGTEKFDNGYKDEDYRMWNLGLDINLYSKIIFLTLEYGELHMFTNNDKGIFASIGPKIRCLNIFHNNLFVYAGLIASVTVIGGFVISSKYLYSFNPFIGASFGVKYFYTGQRWWTFMAGIQIFTN